MRSHSYQEMEFTHKDSGENENYVRVCLRQREKKTRERSTVVELGELQDQLVDIMWYIADDSGGRCEDKKNRDRQR